MPTVIGPEGLMSEGEKICEEICEKASRNCSRRIPTLRISFSLASPMSVKCVDCAFSQTSPAAEPGRETEDPWDERLDALRAHGVLDGLGAHHRAALTLRYLDGLPVPEVAVALNRTVHATEALLVRARAAFRRAYQAGVDR